MHTPAGDTDFMMVSGRIAVKRLKQKWMISSRISLGPFGPNLVCSLMESKLWKLFWSAMTTRILYNNVSLFNRHCNKLKSSSTILNVSCTLTELYFPQVMTIRLCVPQKDTKFENKLHNVNLLVKYLTWITQSLNLPGRFEPNSFKVYFSVVKWGQESKSLFTVRSPKLAVNFV